MEVTLDVPEDCEKEGCFLVSFANGELRSSSKKQPKFSVYRKEGTASKKRKIMVAETDQMTYVGTNYDESSQSSTANLCKYYVGAVDRETKRMTVHRAELMHLRPYIPGKTDLDLTTHSESPTKLEKSRVQEEMVTLFGSERRKRAFAAHKRNKVDSEALETALASAVSHVATSLETAASADTTVPVVLGSGLAPPYNPRAETPRDVYNISDVIYLDDLRAVQATGKVFTATTTDDITQWREQTSYPGYVLSRVPGLPSSEPERSLKAGLLLYSSWLIQMYTHNPRDFEKKGLQLSGESPQPDVMKRLLEKFSEVLPERPGKKVRRRLTSKMKDKILLHLLVLTLIVDDFSVDCSTLQQDLKITTKKLMENYKSLGCRVSKSGVKRKSGDKGTCDGVTSCTVVLRIPLEFPRVRKGRKK